MREASCDIRDPVEIPDGFARLGHICVSQLWDQPTADNVIGFWLLNDVSGGDVHDQHCQSGGRGFPGQSPAEAAIDPDLGLVPAGKVLPDVQVETFRRRTILKK